jgi:hypothetical protein
MMEVSRFTVSDTDPPLDEELFWHVTAQFRNNPVNVRANASPASLPMMMIESD